MYFLLNVRIFHLVMLSFGGRSLNSGWWTITTQMHFISSHATFAFVKTKVGLMSLTDHLDEQNEEQSQGSPICKPAKDRFSVTEWWISGYNRAP